MSHRIVLALSLAMALCACDRKAQGQTVAVVNKEEITAAELNAELANSGATSTVTPATRAAALERIIERRLLAQQARADGLDKSPDFLNQQRRATEDLLINMLVTRQGGTAQVPSADEINKFEAVHPEVFAKHEIWTLSQIIYPLSKDAGVNAKLRVAKNLDEVAQILAGAGIQFTRATRKVDTSIFPSNIYNQIENVKDGEPFIAPGEDKAVASVITAREPAQLGEDQARTIALNGVKREKLQQIVQTRLKTLRSSAKIEYQKGFEPPKGSRL